MRLGLQRLGRVTLEESGTREGNARQLAFLDNLHPTHLERILQGLLVHSPGSGRVDLVQNEHVALSSFEMSPEGTIPFPIIDIDQKAML